MRLPNTLAEISPAWLTQALSQRHQAVEVADVAMDTVLHGTATKAKLRLTYKPSPQAAALPEFMWVKAGMEAHSDFMATLGIYEHEALFYRDVAEPLAVKAPKAFFAGTDPVTRQGVLLLEDLGARDAVTCRASAPVATEAVAMGLDALAQLHAGWYEDPILERYPWLDPPLQPDDHYFTSNSTAAVLDKWINEPRGRTFPARIRDPERLDRALRKLSRLVLSEGHGVIHGDAHIGNSYTIEGRETGFYDWQVVGRGPPLFDVAYYMGSALETAERRRSERDLIRHYVERRTVYGSDKLDFDTAWLGYRRYLIYGCWAWVTNPPEFQPEDLNVITSNRFAAAMDDLETFESLEGLP